MENLYEEERKELEEDKKLIKAYKLSMMLGMLLCLAYCMGRTIFHIFWRKY
jgi:hypothetical protein